MKHCSFAVPTWRRRLPLVTKSQLDNWEQSSLMVHAKAYSQQWTDILRSAKACEVSTPQSKIAPKCYCLRMFAVGCPSFGMCCLTFKAPFLLFRGCCRSTFMKHVCKWSQCLFWFLFQDFILVGVFMGLKTKQIYTSHKIGRILCKISLQLVLLKIKDLMKSPW